MRFPYTGAGIALIYENSILIGKRSKKPFFKRFSIPGGGREKRDGSALDNAIREFNEETGISFTSLKTRYLDSWKLKLPFFQWITFFYLAYEKPSDFKPDEFYNLDFININDVKKYKCRPFTKHEFKTASKLIKKQQSD